MDSVLTRPKRQAQSCLKTEPVECEESGEASAFFGRRARAVKSWARNTSTDWSRPGGPPFRLLLSCFVVLALQPAASSPLRAPNRVPRASSSASPRFVLREGTIEAHSCKPAQQTDWRAGLRAGRPSGAWRGRDHAIGLVLWPVGLSRARSHAAHLL